MFESFDSLMTRLTPDASCAVHNYASLHMRRMSHSGVGAEHLLLAIMSVEPGRNDVNPVNRMMSDRFGVSLYTLRKAVENTLRPVSAPLVNDLFTPSAVRALKFAGAQAFREQNLDGCITRFNIGFGIAEAEDPIVVSVLKTVGIELEAFKALMEESRYAAAR